MYGRAFFTLSLLVVAAVMAEGCASDDDQALALNEFNEVPSSECTKYRFETTPGHAFPVSENALNYEFLILKGALLAGKHEPTSVAKLGQHKLHDLTVVFKIVNDATQRIDGQIDLGATTPQACIDHPPGVRDIEGLPLETHPSHPFRNVIDYHYKPYTGTEGFPHDVDTYANLCWHTNVARTGVHSFALKHAHHVNAKYNSADESTADTIEVYEARAPSRRWTTDKPRWFANTWLSGSLPANQPFGVETELEYEGDHSVEGGPIEKIDASIKSNIVLPPVGAEANVISWNAEGCGELNRVEYVLALLLRDFGAHARRIVSN